MIRRVTHNILSSAREVAELFKEINTNTVGGRYVITAKNNEFDDIIALPIGNKENLEKELDKINCSNSFLIFDGTASQSEIEYLKNFNFKDMIIIVNGKHMSLRENEII